MTGAAEEVGAADEVDTVAEGEEAVEEADEPVDDGEATTQVGQAVPKTCSSDKPMLTVLALVAVTVRRSEEVV